MKISFENLNKLNSWEYQEFKSLRKKDFDGETLSVLLLILLHLVLASIVATIFSDKSWRNWVEVFAFCTLIPYCWIPAIWIRMALEDFYKRVYHSYSHKSNAFIRFKSLEGNFSHIEQEVKNQLKNYVDYNLRSLINQLRRNLSNEVVYADLIEIFKSNHSFIQEASR